MGDSTGHGNSGFETTAFLRRGDSTWTEIVKNEPIAFLAIAAAAGFLAGGGARSRGSLKIFALLGQIAVSELFGDLASLGQPGTRNR